MKHTDCECYFIELLESLIDFYFLKTKTNSAKKLDDVQEEKDFTEKVEAQYKRNFSSWIKFLCYYFNLLNYVQTSMLSKSQNSAGPDWHK